MPHADPLSFNSRMSGSSPAKMREVLGWFNKCLEEVPAKDRKRVSGALMGMIPRDSDEINGIDWDTYMPLEVRALLHKDKAQSTVPTPTFDDSHEYLPNEVSPQTPLQPEKLSNMPSKSKTTLKVSPSTAKSMASRNVRQQQQQPPPRMSQQQQPQKKRPRSPLRLKRRSTDELLNINVRSEWATLNSDERDRYKNAKRTEAKVQARRRSDARRAPSADTAVEPMLSPPEDDHLQPTTLDFSVPVGQIHIHGEMRCGSLLVADLSTSNPAFVDTNPPDISWWVERGFDHVKEVDHLRNIPEFPITTEYIGWSVVCRYKPTGTLHGSLMTCDTVQTVVGPIPPCDTLTPRLKIRNIVEGSLTVGSRLELPQMKKPFTELPKWYTIFSDDPSASPPPVKGTVLQLKPEHAGCVVKVRFALQSAGPLYCIVGTVEAIPRLLMEKLGSDLCERKKSYRNSWREEKELANNPEPTMVQTPSESTESDSGEGSSEASAFSEADTVSVMDTLREVNVIPPSDPVLSVPPLRMGRVQKAQDAIRRHTEASLDAAAQKKMAAGGKIGGLAPLFQPQKPTINGVTLKVGQHQQQSKANHALKPPKPPQKNNSQPSPHQHPPGPQDTQMLYATSDAASPPPGDHEPSPMKQPRHPSPYTKKEEIPAFEGGDQNRAAPPTQYQGRQRVAKGSPKQVQSSKAGCECVLM